MRGSPSSEDWNKNHYQAGAMKLAVVGLCLSPFGGGNFRVVSFRGTLMRGQQPLEELEKMALSRFGRVRVGKGQAGCSTGEKIQLRARPSRGGAELSHVAVAKGSSGLAAQWNCTTVLHGLHGLGPCHGFPC